MRHETNIAAGAYSGHAEPPPLRVLIITEDDPLYVIEFFRVFFDELPAAEARIIGVTVDQAFHEPILKTVNRMRRLYGLGGVARLGLRYGLAKLRGDTIAAMAHRRGIPLLDTPSVNDPDYLDRVRKLKPDVIMSVAGPEIFSPELLASARLGCVNVHSGRLPAYRGMLPTFWQLLQCEPEVTITVHRMVEKLDAGDILATAPFPLRACDTLDRVMRGAKRDGARLFIRVLNDLRHGRDTGTALDMTTAGYFRFPTPQDVRAFRRLGHRLM